MTRPLRVLFAVGSMGAGGAERQVLDYLRHLDRERFHPLLYLIIRHGPFLAEVPSDVPVHAFQDHHRPPRWNYPGRIYRQQVRDLARVLADEQVDVLCAVTSTMILIAAGGVRLRPTPWAGIVMADPRHYFPEQFTRFRRSKFRLLKRALQEMDAPLAVSAGVRDGTHQFYQIPVDRIQVLYNFVDPERIEHLAAMSPPGLDPERFHVVSVGRLVPQKGHIHLLEAARIVHARGLRNVQFHLLGDGPLQPQFREYIIQNRLQDVVHLAGYTPNPFPSICSSQAFCLPSLYEGLPLALIEALFCMVPAIASDCPSGPREILANGRYGRLVPPGDVPALVKTLEDVVANYDGCIAIAAEAKAFAEQTFTLKIGIARLEDLLWDIRRGLS